MIEKFQFKPNVNTEKFHLSECTGSHSHIHGLGLSDFLEPLKVSQGLVGQQLARKAAGIIIKIVQRGLIAGRAVLLTGQPGTGKTAIAIGMGKSIGDKIPFASMGASEIFSSEISKTEALTQAVRKAIGILVREETEIIQGEVVDITVDKPKTGQIQKRGRLTLKSTEMDAIYDIGEKMIELLMINKIVIGDIISIEKSTGKITCMGRSISYDTVYDVTGSEKKIVLCPEGDLQKHKVIIHEVTLHEIDIVNSRSNGFLAIFAGDTGEISTEVRHHVDNKLIELQEEGKLDFVPGILFIDEVHILDIECFSYLTRVLESELAPLLVFASNRALTKIRGTNLISPHGIPMDLLDRMLIINTLPYSEKEIKIILDIRSNEENVKLAKNSIDLIVKIGKFTSLRYAIQLITVSNMIARKRKSPLIYTNDISKAYSMFIDVRRSVHLLIEHQEEIRFSDALRIHD